MIPRLWERRFDADPTDRRHHKGGGGTSNSPTTTNRDGRQALQDSIGVSGDGNQLSMQTSTSTDLTSIDSRDQSMHIVDNSSRADAGVLQALSQNLPDAVRFVADASTGTLKNLGGSIVDLNRDSLKANSQAWDSTLQVGAGLVDKLIDKMGDGFDLGKAAISNFAPTENKQADSIKWAAGAAVAVVLLSVMGGKKA